MTGSHHRINIGTYKSRSLMVESCAHILVTTAFLPSSTTHNKGEERQRLCWMGMLLREYVQRFQLPGLKDWLLASSHKKDTSNCWPSQSYMSLEVVCERTLMKRQRPGQHVTEDKKSKELAVGQDSSLHSSLTPCVRSNIWMNGLPISPYFFILYEITGHSFNVCVRTHQLVTHRVADHGLDHKVIGVQPLRSSQSIGRESSSCCRFTNVHTNTSGLSHR